MFSWFQLEQIWEDIFEDATPWPILEPERRHVAPTQFFFEQLMEVNVTHNKVFGNAYNVFPNTSEFQSNREEFPNPLRFMKCQD